jgi:hypothetical protein
MGLKAQTGLIDVWRARAKEIIASIKMPRLKPGRYSMNFAETLK